MTLNPVIVATDGSALNNPNGPAGWAWYVDKERWNYGSLPKASNQVAELYAILKALKDIPANVPLHIKTDSSFWVKTIGENARDGWMFGWKRRGWIKPDGKVPANLKLLRILDKLLSERRAPVRLEWVKGHNGHQMNEIADKLCTKASAMQSKGQSVTDGGPGWKSLASTTSSRIPSSVLRPNNTPVARATKKIAPAKRRKPVERDVIHFFDDDGPIMPEVKREKKGTYCESCDRPINLTTGECACSD